MHYEGLKAEYAVAKLLQAELDRRLYHRRGDKGPDLTLPDGRTVQVKYRAKRGWSFALTTDNPEEFNTDLGILVWPVAEVRRGDEQEVSEDVDLVGWISRDEFLDRCRRQNYTGAQDGDRLVVEREDMNPMETLCSTDPSPAAPGSPSTSRPPGSTGATTASSSSPSPTASAPGA